jgi:hypothetical protein
MRDRKKLFQTIGLRPDRPDSVKEALVSNLSKPVTQSSALSQQNQPQRKGRNRRSRPPAIGTKRIEAQLAFDFDSTQLSHSANKANKLKR